MLITIAAGDVRLGMFIQGFTGSWFSHPFWKSRFILTSEADFERVRQSGVSGVIIDTAAGVGPPGIKLSARKGSADGFGYQAQSRSRTLATFKRDFSQVVDDSAEKAARRQTRRIIAKSVGATRAIFDDFRSQRAMDLDAVADIVDDIAASIQDNGSMIIDLTRLRENDKGTYVHSVAVSALMVNLALELEMDDEDVSVMGVAGMLHDIGKSILDPDILNKPTMLDESETVEMRLHVQNGYEMILGMTNVDHRVLDVCLNHHERLDGSGYPNGRLAMDLSIASRMAAICDVYDALTSTRPYKKPWLPVAAITHMADQPDQIDPRLLFSFMRSIGVFPAGTLVRLRSNQLGIALKSSKPKTPQRVRVFWSISENALITPYDILPTKGADGDQVVSREMPAKWGFKSWDKLHDYVVKQNTFGIRRAA
ncbi:HD-GYP domain-containing protein [Sphingomonas sp. PP-CC-3G-468]|uniref:HD-GYP domain-containing protein n=1 Tax=Sphingomonas sp. PP-CC-3G-468 TaxID=2135656 RepID=UPI00104508CE|nr:HD-GYP domain-containing protein [Sphingomonas sp. PP-CC-3G-468]